MQGRSRGFYGLLQRHKGQVVSGFAVGAASVYGIGGLTFKQAF
jgi:hypothetical protein